MAAFQSIASTAYGSRTNTTVAAPSGITDGDLLLFFIVTAAGTDAPNPTPPSGFVLLPGTWPMDIADAGGFNVESRGYYKYASGESGSYTATHSSCSSQAVMLRISDPPGAPFAPQVTLNAYNQADKPPVNTTFLGVTAPDDGTLIVLFAHDWADTSNNLSPPTGTTPTFTERLDTTLTYVATGLLVTAGATGNKTMANNSAGESSPWAAALIAIPPAGESAATVERSAAVGGSAAISATGSFFSTVSGLTSLGAAAGIGTSAEFWSILIRSAALAATGGIAAAGAVEDVFGTHSASAGFDATAAIAAASLREAIRSASAGAAGSIAAASLRGLQRTASLSATAAVGASPAAAEWTYGGEEGTTYGPHPGVTYGGGAGWSYGGTAPLTFTYGG